MIYKRIPDIARNLAVPILLLSYVRQIRADCVPVKNPDVGSHAFPDFFFIVYGNFTMEVEMTQPYYNQTNYVRHSYYKRPVGEYWSPEEEHAVRVDTNGSYVVYHYFPEERRFIEERDDSCSEPDKDKPSYSPYGWYDDNFLYGLPMYGPATILRDAHSQNAKYDGSQFIINNIICEKWHICYNGNTLVDFYFSALGIFDMPEKDLFDSSVGNRFPVMFEVFDGEEGHTIYNVLDFIPHLTNHSYIETPRGLACEGMVSLDPYRKPPEVPKAFSFAQEVITNPYLEGVMLEKEQHLDKYELTYSDQLSIVKLESTPTDVDENDPSFYDKILHDFNTGVEYAINRQSGVCDTSAIPQFAFDTKGTVGGITVMAGPNELFHLDSSYAYVGPRDVRSIQGDLFTSTRTDIPDPEDGYVNYPKAVLEYYFTQGTESSTDAVKVPARGDLYIYNGSDSLTVQNMTTFNAYDASEIKELSTDQFNVNECYDQYSDDWSTLYIFFPAKKLQFAAEAADEHGFEHHIFSLLLSVGDISPTRIGKIQVSDGTSGWYSNTTDSDTIVVLVKLMERAPYLFGYRQPENSEETPGDDEPEINVDDAQDCAKFCTVEDKFQCKSFHYCAMQGSCYLSNSTTALGPQTKKYKCDHYIDNHENNTFNDLPTAQVDSKLTTFIMSGNFTFTMDFRGVNVTFTATDHLLFKTPDPTDPIRREFSTVTGDFSIANPDATVLLGSDKSSLACMTTCVDWIDFRCETISHNMDTGKCLLYSQHLSDMNKTRLVPAINFYIHTRVYITDYKPILGGISLNTKGPLKAGNTPEDCAKFCSESQDYNCNSFEFCWDKRECHLHVETFIDVSDGGNYSQHQPCIHFEKRAEQIFTRYPHQGMPNKDHRLVVQLSTVSECAKLCLQDTEETCQSYDFCYSCGEDEFPVCGEDQSGGISMCFLGNHHLGETGIQLMKSYNCAHYSRDLFGDQDYAAWVASHRENPYTAGSMAGLAVGMIFLGMFLALGFLFVVTKYSPSALPHGMNLIELSSRNNEPSV